MRLDFNILWFENQPDDVATTITEIREHLAEAGFNPLIDIEVDPSNLGALSKRQQDFNDFDLVLVDWDLGSPDMQGDEVADEVRRHFGFTDIIFYSGKAVADLRGMIHKRQIDGVYCMPRDRLTDRLRDHIDEVVKRLSRLESMRGIAMGVVGRCDNDLRRFLSVIHDKADDSGRVLLASKLDEIVSAGQQSAVKKYAECQDFASRLDSRAVTSFHLQKLALAVTKGHNRYAECRKLLCEYDKQVLSPRNSLGHSIEKRGDYGWEVETLNGETLTVDDFVTLRNDFHVHLANIAKIAEIAGSN